MSSILTSCTSGVFRQRLGNPALTRETKVRVLQAPPLVAIHHLCYSEEMKTFKSPPIHRTPLYRVKASYSGMQQRCLNANGKSPTYAKVELRMTKEQFIAWALPLYAEFIKKRPGESPCTARFGDKGHYEIGNVKVISMDENRKEAVRPAPAKNTHGTLSSYRYCRCELCKEAWRKHGEQYRRSRGIKPRKPVGPTHGTRNAYTYHKCRCKACMKANRDYARTVRAGKSVADDLTFN